MITNKQLKQYLHYNPETGIFVRIKSKRSSEVGKQAGCSSGHKYVHIYLFGKYYQAHRLAWLFITGKWPKEFIDHINGNCEDNRFVNLREADRKINNQNQRKAQKINKVGLLGVCKHRNKYQAAISIDGYPKYLGHFDTPELAHKAYVEAKRNFHVGNTL